MKVDVSMHLHFQIQVLFINRKNTLEQKALIPREDKCTICSIISATMFRDDERIIFKRLNLVFRITTPGVDWQLLIQDGPLGYKLMILSSMYMWNCVTASTDISPLLGLCTRNLKVTGKGMSPLRSRILSSPVSFKEVITIKNPCSLNDFLVAKYSIKRRITAS